MLRTCKSTRRRCGREKIVLEGIRFRSVMVVHSTMGKVRAGWTKLRDLAITNVRIINLRNSSIVTYSIDV